jgi:hypothetical protein
LLTLNIYGSFERTRVDKESSRALSLETVEQRPMFEGAFLDSLILKMDVLCSVETSVRIYQKKRRHKSKELNNLNVWFTAQR